MIKLILPILLGIIHQIHSQGKIYISNPQELQKKFDSNINITILDKPIKGSFSTFGKIPYGFYTIGRLYYDINHKETDYGCKPLLSINIKPEVEPDRYPIIMVDRGNCTFVTKTRNVQNVGGHLAIIVNNNDTPLEQIIMVDDGTARDISIPSVLISQSDGEMIKSFIRENPSLYEHIIIAIEFEIVYMYI